MVGIILPRRNKKTGRHRLAAVDLPALAYGPSKARDVFRITTNLKASQASEGPAPGGQASAWRPGL